MAQFDGGSGAASALRRPWYTRTFWEVDQRCRRARYWLTEYEGRGIEPLTSAYELEFGTIVHAAVAAMLGEATASIDDIVGLALRDLEPLLVERLEESQLEQRATLEGLLRGFDAVVRPHVLQQYDVLCVEQEVSYDHHGVTLGSKPDTLVRSKATGECIYIEWKTTRNTDDRWLQSWHRSPQLVAGAYGAAAQLGVTIDHAYVVGLYKGYEYKGSWSSPWCYPWRKLSDIGGWQWASQRPQSWKGWEKIPAWLLDGGVKEWVSLMPEAELQRLFVWSDAIAVDPALAESWLRQSAMREIQIAETRYALAQLERPEARRAYMDAMYPQNFTMCQPAYGFTCPYVDACWLAHVGADPVGSGGFKWRVPHHRQEPRREE